MWRGLAPEHEIEGPPRGGRTVKGVCYETLGFPFVNSNGIETWNCGIYMMTPESEVAAPQRNRHVDQGSEVTSVGAKTKTVPEWFIPVVTRLFGVRNGKFW